MLIKIKTTTTKKKQRPTKVKARNFLTNIFYKRSAKNDFVNKSFITDCFSFILMYMDLFSLDRKCERRDIILIRSLWDVCFTVNFVTYINIAKILKKLNEINLKFNTCHNIVNKFLKENKDFEIMKISFQKYISYFKLCLQKYSQITI